jgi:hypothetical protein
MAGAASALACLAMAVDTSEVAGTFARAAAAGGELFAHALPEH